MVLFFTSTILPDYPPIILYMGRDKVENEDLIKYALVQDLWFHVDKLSSAHVYLRLPTGMEFGNVPEALLQDCSQLVKANSIIGNKQDNLTILYTPASNLLKRGDMAVGAVSFHSDKKVKRCHVVERVNAIVNRLNKTKVEKDIDHEADKVERLKEEARVRRLEANDRRNAELELSRSRKKESEAKSYDSLYTPKGTEQEEDDEWERNRKEEDFDPEEDFM